MLNAICVRASESGSIPKRPPVCYVAMPVCSHLTQACTMASNIPRYCINYGGAHPTNYRGCPVYLDKKVSKIPPRIPVGGRDDKTRPDDKAANDRKKAGRTPDTKDMGKPKPPAAPILNVEAYVE